MGGRVQPPRACQASMKAISTEADELKPEPRGTLEAKTAWKPLVSSPSSPMAHSTPAAYSIHSRRGAPASCVLERADLRLRKAWSFMSMARIDERGEPDGENAR